MNGLLMLSSRTRRLITAPPYPRMARLAVACALMFGAGVPAHADLGGAPRLPASATLSSAAVQSFQARTGTTALAATTSGAASASTYSVRESTQADGTVEREYLNVDGTVFGVAFSGPFIPDLQSILGSGAFTQYADAREAAKTADTENGIRRGRSAPVNVQTSNVVVQITGHPGAFNGRAWVPTLVPSGLDTANIK